LADKVNSAGFLEASTTIEGEMGSLVSRIKVADSAEAVLLASSLSLAVTLILAVLFKN